MKKYSIRGVVYKKPNQKRMRAGIMILDHKTNTFILLDKNLNKVKSPFEQFIECTTSMFNIPIKL